MWQAPFLSLTAQAFLLTIALAKDSEPAARLISAGLACLSALASVQLMAKHRYYERADTEWLKRYESKYYKDADDGEKLACSVHDRRRKALNYLFIKGAESKRRLDPMTRLLSLPGSYYFWMFVLTVFAVGAAAVFVMTLKWPNLLSGSLGSGDP